MARESGASLSVRKNVSSRTSRSFDMPYWTVIPSESRSTKAGHVSSGMKAGGDTCEPCSSVHRGKYFRWIGDSL